MNRDHVTVGLAAAMALSLLTVACPPTPTRAAAPEARTCGQATALNERVLWQEDFDAQTDPTGFTHAAPKGWTSTSSGYTSGEARWAGWSFTNIRDWTWAVGTDRRHWFTGAHDTMAVIESEHQRLAGNDRMTAELSTPSISLQGESSLELRFDSHYAQGADGQSVAVYVSYDGGPRQELARWNTDRLSAHEALPLAVPAGARLASFTFSYENGHNDKWWGIDNVELVKPMPEPAGAPVATFDVASDIHLQGGPKADAHRAEKYAAMIDLFAAQPDKAGALLLDGDLVETGNAADYAAATDVLRQHPHASGATLYGGGNHEYLGPDGFDAIQNRFLSLAGRRVPWGETVVNGIPALVISTEYYSDVARGGKEPYVELSAQQLAWLGERLDHYDKQGTPVILMNHHPLPQSVSFTHSAWYGNDFYDLAALNRVIAQHSNIVYLSGHTHASYTLRDWWGRYRVDGSGNPCGFAAVNTGSLLNNGLPDGDNDESTLPGDHATALRVKVYPDRVRVEAWDVLGRRTMAIKDFPRPASGAAATAPATTAPPAPHPSASAPTPSGSTSTEPGGVPSRSTDPQHPGLARTGREV